MISQQGKYSKKRYHSSEEYRKRSIKYSTTWNSNHKDRVNELGRVRYAKLSSEDREKRLKKIKRKRKAGLWKS